MTKFAQRSHWFAALGVLLGLSCNAHAQERCAPGVARLVSAQGIVEIQARSEQTWAAGAQDAILCAGDKVTVRKSSRAVVRLEPEQTNVQLGENSTLAIPTRIEGGFSIVEFLKGIGHFISRVPRALNVETPFVNAAVEGTEFIVRVDDKQALVAVSEGKVKASNENGVAAVNGGGSVIAQAGEEPRAVTLDEPMEVVQWALYYPQVINFERYDFARTVAEGWRPTAADSVSAFREGDIKRALALLDEVPDDARDVRLLVYRANVLLAVGRVTEAKERLRQAAEIQPDQNDVVATQTVIAAVQNQREIALTLAQKAVSNAPDSAAALLAMSYAQQARFDLDAALFVTQTAVKKDENNSLAWARLAEIWLMHGELEQAEIAAKWSLKYNPRSSQAHTVRGYSALLRGDFEIALAEFTDASRTDQASPLARLGLGLAKIRLGDLPGGRADMEIATSLDPRNSLLRSYVGKAYFDEKRDAIAERQYEFAKTLDPNDPTPWFYDALLKQAQNRPVEALQNMQKSIDLNDNRAVYRSRLLLDEDRAARGANLARLYTELGFDQLALVEGYRAVNVDPSNYSAHRFLADVYAGLPRHEIARVSELLQAQLLQPLNQSPVQPELAETDLSVLNGSNVLSGGLNEYTSLLLRGGMSARLGLLGANNQTLAEEVSVSYLGDHSAVSAGQFHFETDGFRPNADYSRDVYSGFYQFAIGPYTSSQFEVRASQTDRGDITLRFDPNEYYDQDRGTVETHVQRIGLRQNFDSSSDMLISLVRQRRDETVYHFGADDVAQQALNVKETGVGQVGEVQYVGRSNGTNLIVGYAYVDYNGDSSQSQAITCFIDIPGFCSAGETIPYTFDIPKDATQNTGYLYWTSQSDRGVLVTMGISYDIYDGPQLTRYKFNPKLGLVWSVTPNMTIRAAGFRTLKRLLIADQTLEPVQVAGFNQFFDDDNAVLAWRYGFGADYRISNSASTGFEVSRRDLDFPFLLDTATEKFTELSHRVYWEWSATRWSALSAEYFFERFSRERPDIFAPRILTTQRLPLTVHLSGPIGLSAEATVSYVEQERTLEGDDAVTHRFALFDFGLGYRFLKGSGVASVAINNAFDRHFGYEDTNFQTNQPRIPLFYPERTVVFRLSVRF